MSVFPIPEDVIEAFVREFWASVILAEPEGEPFEAAFQAALKKWGASVEHLTPEQAFHNPYRLGHVPHWRLVTAWTPGDGDS